MFILRGRTRRSIGRWVQQSREEMGRQLARESGVPADLVVPVPDSGVTAAMGYAAESGIPFNFGLIRNHYVGRTFIQPEQRVRDFGVRMKLNPVRSAAGRQARDPDRRLDHPRDDLAEDRADGAGGGSDGGASAHLVSADDFTLFLRGGYAAQEGPDRGEQSVEEICEFIEADSLAYLSLVGLTHCLHEGRASAWAVARELLHGLLYGRLSDAVGGCGGDSAGGDDSLEAAS